MEIAVMEAATATAANETATPKDRKEVQAGDVITLCPWVGNKRVELKGKVIAVDLWCEWVCLCRTDDNRYVLRESDSGNYSRGRDRVVSLPELVSGALDVYNLLDDEQELMLAAIFKG